MGTILNDGAGLLAKSIEKNLAFQGPGGLVWSMAG